MNFKLTNLVQYCTCICVAVAVAVSYSSGLFNMMAVLYIHDVISYWLEILASQSISYGPILQL